MGIWEACAMVSTFTARYVRTDVGYMGQIIEWPEVITEGATLEECREMLRDALKEMVAAHRQVGKEIPVGGELIEQFPADSPDVRQAG